MSRTNRLLKLPMLLLRRSIRERPDESRETGIVLMAKTPEFVK